MTCYVELAFWSATVLPFLLLMWLMPHVSYQRACEKLTLKSVVIIPINYMMACKCHYNSGTPFIFRLVVILTDSNFRLLCSVPHSLLAFPIKIAIIRYNFSTALFSHELWCGFLISWGINISKVNGKYWIFLPDWCYFSNQYYPCFWCEWSWKQTILGSLYLTDGITDLRFLRALRSWATRKYRWQSRPIYNWHFQRWSRRCWSDCAESQGTKGTGKLNEIFSSGI